MTRDELAGLVNAAGVEMAAARSSIVAAQTAMDRARNAIGEALGDGESFTLFEYIHAIDNAGVKAQSVIYSIEGALDKGSEYVGRLYS